MKKIMIALAVVAMTAATQAAALKWSSASNILGVDVTSIDGNGSYAAAGTAVKGNSSLTFTMLLLSEGAEVGEYTGAVKFGSTNKKANTSFTIEDAAQSTTYDYVLTITGTQSDLQALGISGEWDYSAATIEAKITGSLTTAPSGTTTFTADPTSWTVAGAVAVPEPTSGLLLMLGIAGLALRRKQK
jgi:hypothetical protein